MSDTRPHDAPRPFWKDLIGPALTIIVVAITALIFLTNSAAKTDATAEKLADMRTEMRETLRSINGKLEGFPGVLEKLAQLERRQTSQEGYNGAVDARLNAVERLSDANKSALDNIRAASGGKVPMR